MVVMKDNFIVREGFEPQSMFVATWHGLHPGNHAIDWVRIQSMDVVFHFHQSL